MAYKRISPIPVAEGGTSLSTLTSHSLQVGAGTSALTQLGVAGNGALPIGSAGADPVLANITGSGGIVVTNGAGTIALSTVAVSTVTAVNHAASPYTVLAADQFIAADVTAGVISILLPNAPTTGRVITIKDKVGLAATSNISVTTVGGAVTIDGVTTFAMNTAYQAISVIFDGSNYEIY